MYFYMLNRGKVHTKNNPLSYLCRNFDFQWLMKRNCVLWIQKHSRPFYPLIFYTHRYMSSCISIVKSVYPEPALRQKSKIPDPEWPTRQRYKLINVQIGKMKTIFEANLIIVTNKYHCKYCIFWMASTLSEFKLKKWGMYLAIMNEYKVVT